MSQRRYSAADHLMMRLQKTLEGMAPPQPESSRPSPATQASQTQDDSLTAQERAHAAGLMRVNHAGEIAAQALYAGQALTCRDSRIRDELKRAAEEEADHLAWCKQRVEELGERTSKLEPFWYAGSFAIGAAAGLAGDRVSLGFVAETEKQVCAHLQSHLQKLPANDHSSRRIVEQMHAEEAEHGQNALDAGGTELPETIRAIMQLVSKVMTFSAYRI